MAKCNKTRTSARAPSRHMSVLLLPMGVQASGSNFLAVFCEECTSARHRHHGSHAHVPRCENTTLSHGPQCTRSVPGALPSVRPCSLPICCLRSARSGDDASSALSARARSFRFASAMASSAGCTARSVFSQTREHERRRSVLAPQDWRAENDSRLHAPATFR